MQGSYFCLEIAAEGKDILEYKSKEREKFLSEAKRMIDDFVNSGIKCTYTNDPAVRNTTIRIYTY